MEGSAGVPTLQPPPAGSVGPTSPRSPGAPPADGEPKPSVLRVAIVSTTNKLEEEPWLPVRGIVTMFRVQVTADERSWEVQRRYSDFHELNLRLVKACFSLGYDSVLRAQAFGEACLPELPPKLLLNADENIAERYLELDAYLRKLLQTPSVARNYRLLEFLGIAKQGVRYGVRNYEYDSSQSEGNRYIRDNDL